MDNSRKFFTYQFFVITAGTVVGLYIYHKYVSRTQIQPLYKLQSLHQGLLQLESIGSVNRMTSDNIPEPPKYKLEITTCEFDDTNSTWIPTLTHTFYGNSQSDIDALIDSHRQTDSFFNASFDGIFNWKGGTIQLKNITSGTSYTEQT